MHLVALCAFVAVGVLLHVGYFVCAILALLAVVVCAALDLRKHAHTTDLRLELLALLRAGSWSVALGLDDIVNRFNTKATESRKRKPASEHTVLRALTCLALRKHVRLTPDNKWQYVPLRER